ncbi:MAG: cytochrome P450, partial [Cyanobacteriota bacterium]|nr:cytochrome P450 [Cyanobacteriota bacterium]
KIVKSFEFKSYTVPANWNLRMCTFVSHHLPEVFEHPERFDPDRFAPPREEDKRTSFSLIGFGGGQRLCAGKPYAMLFLFALAVTILRDYDWEVLDNQDTSPMLHNRATFLPKSKLKLKFSARQ